ncbi:MAG: 50S ribosomal protein L13 [archaeon]
MIIIDATDLIMGRFATVAAKHALLGEQVRVVNCAKAVISGRKEYIFAEAKRKRDMGTHVRGPFKNRMPDRYVRRVIRGMLPTQATRGREAFKRVMCYIDTPDELKGKPVIQVPGANADKLPTVKKVTVGDICKHLGANWNE